MLKQITKDILTDPENEHYSFVLVLGFLGFITIIIGTIVDVFITGTFEIKDFCDGVGNYIMMIGGVHTAQYAINKFKSKRKEDDVN